MVSMLVWWKIRINKKKTLGYWLFLWLGVAGLLITGSRVIWGVGAILLMTNVKCLMTNVKKIMGAGVVEPGTIDGMIFDELLKLSEQK